METNERLFLVSRISNPCDRGLACVARRHVYVCERNARAGEHEHLFRSPDSWKPYGGIALVALLVWKRKALPGRDRLLGGLSELKPWNERMNESKKERRMEKKILSVQTPRGKNFLCSVLPRSVPACLSPFRFISIVVDLVVHPTMLCYCCTL